MIPASVAQYLAIINEFEPSDYKPGNSDDPWHTKKLGSNQAAAAAAYIATLPTEEPDAASKTGSIVAPTK